MASKPIGKKLFCFYVLILTHSLPCAASEYSTKEINSAMNYLKAKSEININLDKCAKTLYDNKNVFRSITYIWDHDNYDYELASDIVLQSASNTVKIQTNTFIAEKHRLSDNKFKELNQGDKRSFCKSLIDKVADLSLNFEKTNPNDATMLQKTIAKKSDLKIKKRNSDLTLGCIKQLLNDNGSEIFDKALTVCECRTKALINNATSKDIDEWLSKLSKTQDNSTTALNKQKWFQRVNKAMEACK